MLFLLKNGSTQINLGLKKIQLLMNSLDDLKTIRQTRDKRNSIFDLCQMKSVYIKNGYINFKMRYIHIY